MIVEKVDPLIAAYNKKHRKDPEFILINTQDAETMRLELVKANNLESEAHIEFYRNARIIRSDDVYPGEFKLI